MGLLTVGSRPNVYALNWLSSFQTKIVEQHLAGRNVFPETDSENETQTSNFIVTVDLGVDAASLFNAYLTVSKLQSAPCV